MNFKLIITGIIFFVCANLIAQKTKNYKVYFKVDTYELTDSEKTNFISFIQKNKSKIKHISFTGYCDDNADNDYNLMLSEKRAIYVKELAYKQLNKNTHYSLKYLGELGLEKTADKKNQRKENRRVEVTCVFFDEKKTKPKSGKIIIAKKSINKPKITGNNYNDYLNFITESEPGAKKERMEFEDKQRHLDSISKIVTNKEIENFEDEFFNTKIGKPIPTELRYYLINDKNSKFHRDMILKLSSRKKIKLLSMLMYKYPELKVKFYTYAYKEMDFKRRINNEGAKKYFIYTNSRKLFSAINYLINEGIAKDRLSSEQELVKKFKFNASHIDRSPAVVEIIRLN